VRHIPCEVGWLHTSGSIRYVRNICAKMWTRENKKLICFGIFLQKSPISKLRILFQLKFPRCIIINQQTKTQRMAMENKTFDIALSY
jgi:hypothetical protein